MSRGWISEKNYNKTRGGNCHKVLVGNWHEEQVLEGDMITQGMSLETTRLDPNSRRVRGGFESTAYLLSPLDPANRGAAGLNTTYGANYTQENGNVRLLAKPPLGVRSELRAQQVIEASKQSFTDTQRARALAAIPPPNSSTYIETITGTDRKRRTVEGYAASYLRDTPITLYTGNPVSGQKMGVQGGTLPSIVNSLHGKNTQFSNPKYML